MNDQFPPASWFLRPNTLAHWMPNMFWGGVLAAPTSRRDPWDQARFLEWRCRLADSLRASHSRTRRRC